MCSSLTEILGSRHPFAFGSNPFDDILLKPRDDVRRDLDMFRKAAATLETPHGGTRETKAFTHCREAQKLQWNQRQFVYSFTVLKGAPGVSGPHRLPF